jgi:ABC-2 type transport system permease protein
MSNTTRGTIRDNLSIIWAITAKDIVDALKNRLVISLVILSSVMLLLPKMLPLILEQPVATPPPEGVLSLGVATIQAIIMILMMGIVLVPSLLFEEKQTKTLQALLVSPASIGQVVAGKALAGAFYILVTAVLIFAISWADVAHWGPAVLFVIGGGAFSVAMGLVLGSFYDRQQDVVGPMMVLVLILIGALVARLLGVELPALVERILSWIPSVALAEIFRAAFLEAVPVNQILTNLWLVLAVSLLLYGVVIWKVRRSDR